MLSAGGPILDDKKILLISWFLTLFGRAEEAIALVVEKNPPPCALSCNILRSADEIKTALNLDHVV
jgi:hypothetical protein